VAVPELGATKLVAKLLLEPAVIVIPGAKLNVPAPVNVELANVTVPVDDTVIVPATENALLVTATLPVPANVKVSEDPIEYEARPNANVAVPV
jgi:hypothetical protein